MEINDLIFKELIKRGYSLEGNTRVWNIADSKLWYLTPEQAQAYLDLENVKDYNNKMFDTEIGMLKQFMPQISTKVLNGDTINIIDIGCGDGKKAIPVIDLLNEKVKLRYCPIDISRHMVSRAIEKIKALHKGEVVEFRWNISDFDNLENVASLLIDEEFRQNFLLFLGSTISNFEFNEVMYEVAEAMSNTDYLLMGVALNTSTPDEIVKSYTTSKVDKFLYLMLKQIGFERDDVEMGVRFKNSRVEVFYTVKKDRKIDFGDKSLYFQKGDQILVAVSYRYNEAELRTMLKFYFKTVKFYFNDNKTWALGLCKKM